MYRKSFTNNQLFVHSAYCSIVFPSSVIMRLPFILINKQCNLSRGKNKLSIINTNNLKLESLKSSFIFENPNKIYENKLNSYNHLIEKLEVLNPLNTLKRGYTITKHEDKVIKSKKDLEIGDELEVKFDDGSVNTKVVDLKD